MARTPLGEATYGSSAAMMGGTNSIRMRICPAPALSAHAAFRVVGGNAQPAWPQSFSALGVWLLIVLVPGFGSAVCLLSGDGRAVVPGMPGCAPAPTAPDVPPFVSLGWSVLVRRVLAGRTAAASR